MECLYNLPLNEVEGKILLVPLPTPIHDLSDGLDDVTHDIEEIQVIRNNGEWAILSITSGGETITFLNKS